jgi:hypothetical protein
LSFDLFIGNSLVFCRRFCALHPPPLLGFFFDPNGATIPAFAPLRCRSDPDLRAVVHHTDFFLIGLLDNDDDFPGWVIDDCHDGYLILNNFNLNGCGASLGMRGVYSYD